MKKFEIMYLPIGVPTFHLTSAREAFRASIDLLKSIEGNVLVPEDLLLSIDALKAFIGQHQPDLVIVQNVTFANSNYGTEIFKRLKAPMILWTLREPVIDGGRLRLNSLTGAFSAGNAFRHMRPSERLLYLFGSPEEETVKKTLHQMISAALVKHEMNDMNLLMIGHTPQGFGFGRALDLEMAKTFGVNLLAIESRELTQIAKTMKADEATEAEAIASKRMVKLDQTDKTNRVDFFKLYQVYKQYIKDHNIKAIASRCWPDFFTDYGTPVCGVLGMLNDDAVAAACEADAYGALSMFIGQRLSGQPTFLGDPVSLDEAENTMTFWHCGTGACSLARPDTGALTGVHPNRKIGPTMEFGFKASEKATIFRIGRLPNGQFRALILKAEILDKPKQFSGTSMVVAVKPEVKSLVGRLVKEGWEPHFVIVYQDVVEELSYLAEMLNIDVCKYEE